jgi:hypothetical protein
MRHEHIETNSGLMIVLILLVISIGGLVEIVPLFYINETIEKVDGVRPYTPLELRGATSTFAKAAICAIPSRSARSATSGCATATIRWRRNRSTTIRSSGVPSAPVPIWRGWAASTPTSGMCST